MALEGGGSDWGSNWEVSSLFPRNAPPLLAGGPHAWISKPRAPIAILGRPWGAFCCGSSRPPPPAHSGWEGLVLSGRGTSSRCTDSHPGPITGEPASMYTSPTGGLGLRGIQARTPAPSHPLWGPNSLPRSSAAAPGSLGFTMARSVSLERQPKLCSLFRQEEQRLWLRELPTGVVQTSVSPPSPSPGLSTSPYPDPRKRPWMPWPSHVPHGSTRGPTGMASLALSLPLLCTHTHAA